MALNWVQLVGLIAASLTTLSYLPQAIKAWRTRHTADISIWTLFMLCAGIILWLAYGLLIRDVPLIAANALTLVLALCVLVAKMRFG